MRRSVRATAAVFAALAPYAAAHRGLLTKPSCDGDFGGSATALAIPDPSISWYLSHYFDCSHRALWASFTNPAEDFAFYVGLSTPPLPRFADLRADALIVGPGLPQLSAEDWKSLPEEVRSDPVWGDSIGAVLHRSPADQSTCAHMGTVMTSSTSVVEGRCDFFEPYGRTHSWRLLDADDNLLPIKNAVYYVVAWFQGRTSGKMGIALGTWVEDFVRPLDIATPSCERTIVDWSEKLGDQGQCLPVTDCPVDAPIPKVACIAQGSCGQSRCDDTLADHAMCMFAQMCDCAVVTQTHPCGSKMESAMGDVDINSVCGLTCGSCGSEVYEAKMACGGSNCPSSVKLWDGANKNMMQNMAIKYTCDPAVDFVRGMIPHHAGALEMCEVLVGKLACEEDGALDGLVHFCNHVRWEQELQIAGMKKWLRDNNHAESAACVVDDMGGDMGDGHGHMHGGSRRLGEAGHDMASDGTHSSGHHDMQMGCGNLTCKSSAQFIEAAAPMHAGMAVDVSCNPAVDFVRAMIPHHAGAIRMCQILADNAPGMDAYLVELCANITYVQYAEIAFMSQWLVARGHKISASCEQCEEGATKTPPELPCEDTLPTSSFCHALGGDFFCTCAGVVAEHECGSIAKIKGFGHLNVSTECQRTCGHCPAERVPLFHSPCAHSEGSHNHHPMLSGSFKGFFTYGVLPLAVIGSCAAVAMGLA